MHYCYICRNRVRLNLLQMRLPRDKVTKCVDIITVFLPRKKVQLKELQCLLGLLNFATTFVT